MSQLRRKVKKNRYGKIIPYKIIPLNTKNLKVLCFFASLAQHI